MVAAGFIFAYGALGGTKVPVQVANSSFHPIAAEFAAGSFPKDLRPFCAVFDLVPVLVQQMGKINGFFCHLAKRTA